MVQVLLVEYPAWSLLLPHRFLNAHSPIQFILDLCYLPLVCALCPVFALTSATLSNHSIIPILRTAPFFKVHYTADATLHALPLPVSREHGYTFFCVRSVSSRVVANDQLPRAGPSISIIVGSSSPCRCTYAHVVYFNICIWHPICFLSSSRYQYFTLASYSLLSYVACQVLRGRFCYCYFPVNWCMYCLYARFISSSNNADTLFCLTGFPTLNNWVCSPSCSIVRGSNWDWPAVFTRNVRLWLGRSFILDGKGVSIAGTHSPCRQLRYTSRPI